VSAETIHELDALDAIDGDPDLRGVVLRLARLADEGRLPSFVRAVETDSELNRDTRNWLLWVAREPFLGAAERYAELSRPGQKERGYNRPTRAISSVG
jgi:hypothetical protein